ncbi:MAG: hypothetical protein A3F54_00750 [Candidatus Kerfeldbacteria bacterium RIFCSPHIGHO2_12_FULL_48_17]|uniref:Uncharacterized protein n=1 Tax=Candidatus Kerfeldbacteria bacterium RIFCSPHIGHO2_12_FULL_48_17 TaxID=1798542 RepID=A0A1G2B4H1_9BACT|nr:MAG: hypothetical protein A3F54_00750 [Candidatus Kerfeldbacteria bacterium RIFCSPHIGHO2_12_FULL_48_17]
MFAPNREGALLAQIAGNGGEGVVVVEGEEVAHAFVRVRVRQLFGVECFEQALLLFGDFEGLISDAAGFLDGGHRWIG